MNRTLHITVGIANAACSLAPGGLDLATELQLAKAAILYGDTATLCSTSCAMFKAVESIVDEGVSSKGSRQFDLVTPIVETYTPHLKEEIDFENIEKCATIYRNLLRKKRLGGLEMRQKMKLEAIIRKLWRNLRDSVQRMQRQAKYHDLLLAESEGLLKIRPAQTDIHTTQSNALVHEMVDFFYQSVLDSDTYPLFDDLAGSIIRNSIREGKLDVPEAASERSRHLGLAASLLQSLPLFDKATVKEAIDIRRELDRPLIRFRAAILTFTDNVKTSQWDSAFLYEANKIFDRDVRPAILDIEDRIKSNSYMRSLISRFAKKPSTLSAPLLSLIISDYTSIPQAVALSFGVAAVGANIYDVRKDVEDKLREISGNHLFFLYAVDRRLK